jgi:hypothetical protein
MSASGPDAVAEGGIEGSSTGDGSSGGLITGGLFSIGFVSSTALVSIK